LARKARVAKRFTSITEVIALRSRRLTHPFNDENILHIHHSRGAARCLSNPSARSAGATGATTTSHASGSATAARRAAASAAGPSG
jgi:hypothetical protein